MCALERYIDLLQNTKNRLKRILGTPHIQLFRTADICGVFIWLYDAGSFNYKNRVPLCWWKQRGNHGIYFKALYKELSGVKM